MSDVLKILIVDDKDELRSLISATLSTGDFEILEADNGKEALAVARAEHPKLMILDVAMAGDLDGLEVCRHLKGDPATKDIQIIMLTSFGQERDKQRGKEAGADDYFVKPFSPRELMDKVYAMLKL
jgi:two-component system phosphate regulon response regulator PhoB